MQRARAHHLESSNGHGPELRVVGHRPQRARPAWGRLAAGLTLTMALWATGILQLAGSYRRLVDVIGAAVVLTVLVVWVRVNAPLLAAATQPDRENRLEDRLRARLIRSRRPPLAALTGPDVQPRRRRSGRVPPS